ncbi:ARI5A protein, partial [Corythaeola cristata]|nr:ARI5A protein [Corythaeola cristata]
MSPLAKKKLLAQVSKAEALHCHKRHCPEPPRPPTGSYRDEQRSPEPSGTRDTAPNIGSKVGPMASASPGGRDGQPCPPAEEGDLAPTVFTGCFHAYHKEVLKPISCQPLWGDFSSLKDFLEPPSSFPSRAEESEQPQDLRSKAGQAWSRESRRAAVKGCWVPPGAGVAPAAPRGKRSREEEMAFGPSTKLRTADGRDTGAGSPRGHQRLAKPKAVVASPGYAAAL